MNKSAEGGPSQLYSEPGKCIEIGILTPDSDTNILQIGQRVHGPTWLLFLLISAVLVGIPLSCQAGILET